MKKFETAVALLAGCSSVSAQLTLPVETKYPTAAVLPDASEIEQNLKTIPVLSSTSATVPDPALNINDLPTTLATEVRANEEAAEKTTCRCLRCLPVASLRFTDLDALGISWRPPVPTGIPEDRAVVMAEATAEAPAELPAEATAGAVAKASLAAFSVAFEPQRSAFVLPPHEHWETARPNPTDQVDPYSQWVLTASPTTYRLKAIDVPHETTCVGGEFWHHGRFFCSRAPIDGKFAAIAEPTGVVEQPHLADAEVKDEDEEHVIPAAEATPQVDVLSPESESDGHVLVARQDGIYRCPPPGPQCIMWCRVKRMLASAVGKETPEANTMCRRIDGMSGAAEATPQAVVLSPESQKDDDHVLVTRQDGIYRCPPPGPQCIMWCRLKRMLARTVGKETPEANNMCRRQDGMYRPPPQPPMCIWFCRLKQILGFDAVPADLSTEAVNAETEASSWGAVKRMLGGGAGLPSHSLKARQALQPPGLPASPPLGAIRTRPTPPKAEAEAELA